MSERNKLNEVIYTLERCSDVQREAIDHVYVCPVCPYAVNVDEHGGLPCESLAPLMDDALALLKKREPRVMTLEEVKAFAKREDDPMPIWGEWYQYAPNAQVWWEAYEVQDNLEYGRCELSYNRKTTYGIRYWTSRPTYEQRERAKWDDALVL